MEPFTFEAAFNIQLADITRWSKVLNTEAYTNVVNEALSRNAKGYKSPYDVFRGSDITNYICNLSR